MSQAKKQHRAAMREQVWQRDGQACRVCRRRVGDTSATGSVVLTRSCFDAHHITPRVQMPNGGTIASNLITLCIDCHHKAELVTWADDDGYLALKIRQGEISTEDARTFSRGILYKLIGSSYAKSLTDSEAHR